MQNKGIVIVLAVLMTLASIFYLSFSVATNYYDSEAAKIKDRFPKRQTMPYDEVAAFAMKDGKIESIMDEDFRLISAEALDSASQEIADDYNFLLNV